MNETIDMHNNDEVSAIAKAMELMRSFFDNIEAYAYTSGGEVILRLEYEVIVVKVPLSLGLSDLSSYLFGIGAQTYNNRTSLEIAIKVSSGIWLAFRAAVIHTDNGWKYIAVVPRKILRE